MVEDDEDDGKNQTAGMNATAGGSAGNLTEDDKVESKEAGGDRCTCIVRGSCVCCAVCAMPVLGGLVLAQAMLLTMKIMQTEESGRDGRALGYSVCMCAVCVM